MDYSGYVSINHTPTDFPVWAILLIVFGSLIIIGVVVLVVIRRVRARKLAQQAGGNYNAVEPSSQPYFNNNPNQGFSANNAYQPNQGFNPSNNQNPQVYNPYPQVNAN